MRYVLRRLALYVVAAWAAVTLGFVVIAGGYLGLLDAIWKPLIEAIL